MEIKEEDFQVIYKDGIIKFSGSIRLQNLAAYDHIKILLKNVLNEPGAGKIIMDLRELNFLNSSGITTLSMFFIDARKKMTTKVELLGSSKVSWQEKSLANFKKLWSDVELKIE